MSGAARPAPPGAMSLLERGAGAPRVETMPLPALRIQLPMRDGVRLDTSIWMRGGAEPAPAILMRTPYREQVMGWARLGVMRYVEAGYVLVIQLIRGVGASEGHFTFNSPHEAGDGYDTVEWIAAQGWCDGAVGMDGSSYLGMTQLRAASARPPHLRCIVPCVPSVDFFREIPYLGGIFSRLHAINWGSLLQVESLAEQTGGFVSAMPILSQPAWLRRISSRPLQEAANDWLRGDMLAHYRDILAHPTFDAWWRERTLDAADYAAMDLPVLLVSGNFDLGIGALTLWRRLEAHADGAARRQLLIGPWDHGQAYAGGAAAHGPYQFGADAAPDMVALRLAFFDRYLRGQRAAMAPAERVRLYITGSNQWRDFDIYPPRQVAALPLYLRSGGAANSARGDGRLAPDAPPPDEPADHFISDPVLPFVPALASADPALQFDVREMERCHDVLVYGTTPLAQPWTVLGEAELTLHLAANTPDCDVVAILAEARADGSSVRLAVGALRLRYREGFQREVLLTPGSPVKVQLSLTYVAHQVPAGSRLRLLIGGTLFPLLDPNPNTGEPVAGALAMQAAHQTVFHDAQQASVLHLPLLGH